MNGLDEKTDFAEPVYRKYLKHESHGYHHSYDEELKSFEYIRQGDSRSIAYSQRLYGEDITGRVAEDPLTNDKFLFVSYATLTTRFCIEGGMDEIEAYALSDSYLRRLEKSDNREEVHDLHLELVKKFTERMREIRNKTNDEKKITDTDVKRGFENVSKEVFESIDYIYYHLNEKMTIPEIANNVSLSADMLSNMFKRQKGITIQDYINSKRIEAAKNMLADSDYSQSEISGYLAFSSESYFIRKFKEITGVTPAQYRRQYQREKAYKNEKP